MNDFTFTERRTCGKLIELGKALYERADKIAEGLGSDIDGMGIFGEEVMLLVDAILSSMNLDPEEWNEDLIYGVMSGRESLDTLYKFAVRVNGDYSNLGFMSSYGYFFIDENPELASKLNTFMGGALHD